MNSNILTYEHVLCAYNLDILFLFIVLEDELVITSFEIYDEETLGGSVTKDEFSPAIFICLASSPFLTNTSLTKDGETVSYVVNITQLVYTIDNSSCDDMGTYTCSASSGDTNASALASIEYVVRCK